MFKQIFPIVAEFAQQKALPIRVDRLLAQKKVLILKGLLVVMVLIVNSMVMKSAKPCF